MEFTAVVLAGGMGTRLRSMVADRPKVLAPVAGRPFLCYLLDQIRDAGGRRVILSTGYLAEHFAEEIGDDYRGMAIAYAQEATPLGTGGAIKFAGGFTDDELLLVMNGDSYVDFSLGDYLGWHSQNGNDASLLLAIVSDASRYGTVTTDSQGRVTAFMEKRPERRRGAINAGIYALRRSLLEDIPSGACSFERDVMPQWIGKFNVQGMAVECPFIDIGVPEDYQRSHAFMERVARD